MWRLQGGGLLEMGCLLYFPKPPLGDRLNTKPRDYDTPKPHNRRFDIFYHEGTVTYDFIQQLRAHDHSTRLWKWLAIAFGLGFSQFHDHCPWLVWSGSNLSSIEMVGTIQVHFILEGEGLRSQTHYHEWKSLHGFLHNILWMMNPTMDSWSTGICVGLAS